MCARVWGCCVCVGVGVRGTVGGVWVSVRVFLCVCVTDTVDLLCGRQMSASEPISCVIFTSGGPVTCRI